MSKSYSGTLQVVVFLAHSLTIDLISLPTLIAILCPERLKLFEHRPFYDLLPSMFVRTMRGAGQGVHHQHKSGLFGWPYDGVS